MPPTKTATIRCQHCAEAFKTRRPAQAKWCITCREIKALVALAKKPAKCLACDKRYFKHERSQILCVTCETAPPGVENHERPCAYCDAVTGLVPGIKLCYKCCGNAEHKTHSRIVKSLVGAHQARAVKSPTADPRDRPIAA